MTTSHTLPSCNSSQVVAERPNCARPNMSLHVLECAFSPKLWHRHTSYSTPSDAQPPKDGEQRFDEEAGNSIVMPLADGTKAQAAAIMTGEMSMP